MPDLSDIVDALAGLVESAVLLARHSEAWIAVAYARAPALTLGLAIMLALLPMTALGSILRRARYSEMTLAHLRRRREHTGTARPTTEVARWPADAWVEMAGGTAYWIGRRMVRIGRDDDNEIRIGARTVHRHHAVIHRTEDAEFMIKDLSSAEGNGVVVNGRRVGEARLSNGDTLVLGEAVLKFHLQPA